MVSYCLRVFWHEGSIENIAVRFFRKQEVSLVWLWLLLPRRKATEASSKCSWMAAQQQ